MSDGSYNSGSASQRLASVRAAINAAMNAQRARLADGTEVEPADIGKLIAMEKDLVAELNAEAGVAAGGTGLPFIHVPVGFRRLT